MGGVKRMENRTIHNFSACAELQVAITRQVRRGNSRDPVGMTLSSSKELIGTQSY